MRDDVSQATIQRLAKRVGFKCSNPDCRKPTSGPRADGGTVNLGVAAHITAASPGGPRFDGRLRDEVRCAAENGIWLCQQCSRLVDADDSAHDVANFVEWKTFAEAAAAVELRGYVIRRGRNFASLESRIPELVAEMRTDIQPAPFTREFVVLSRRLVYNPGPVPFFCYYHEDHGELLARLQVFEHYGAIYDVRRNDVPRWNFTEEFAEYLLGSEAMPLANRRRTVGSGLSPPLTSRVAVGRAARSSVSRVARRPLPGAARLLEKNWT